MLVIHRDRILGASRRVMLAGIALAAAFVILFASATPAVAQTTGYPRIAHWWGSATATENVKVDYYVPTNGDPLHPDTSAISALRSSNPGVILLASSSAAELDYSATNDAAYNAERLAAIPTSWILTQVGSTLSAGLTASATSVSVADTSKFRVDDLVVIDNERCVVTAVGSTLTVKRGYAGSTAAAHTAGARVAAGVSGWKNAVTLDMTANCPQGRATGSFATPGTGTETARDWLARRTAGIYRAANWDGVMIDVCVADYATTFRGLTGFRTVASPTAPSTEVNYTTFDAAWRVGIETYLSAVRTHVGQSAIVMTNEAPPAFATVNGSNLEGFPSSATTTEKWHQKTIGPRISSRGSYFDWCANGRTPNLTTIMTYGAATDYRMMRWGLTTALMANGYYAYEASTDTHSIKGRWYDEYDNAGAGRGYLGAPVGAARAVATDVYRRDFDNGVALVNATDVAVTVDLGGVFRKIRGTQVPTLNDGSLVTAVTIGPKDGLVVLREATAPVTAPIAKADAYSTAYATTLNVAAPGLLGNDTDPQGATLTAAAVTQPAHGTLALNADGSFTYTPAAGFSGADSFAYRVHNGTEYSAAAVVSVSVAAAPVVVAPTPTVVDKPAVKRVGRKTSHTYTVSGSVQLGSTTTVSSASTPLLTVASSPVVLEVQVERYVKKHWRVYRRVRVVNPSSTYKVRTSLKAGKYRARTVVSGGSVPAARSAATKTFRTR